MPHNQARQRPHPRLTNPLRPLPLPRRPPAPWALPAVSRLTAPQDHSNAILQACSACAVKASATATRSATAARSSVVDNPVTIPPNALNLPYAECAMASPARYASRLN